ASSSIRQTSSKTQPRSRLLWVAMPSSFEDAVAESVLLSLANSSRRQAGLPPLRFDPNLIQAARAHARLMVAQGQLSHQFEGEAPLMSRLRKTGIRLDSVGENVAYDHSPEQAFDALMHSPPHRQNLLDPAFNTAGFAAFWSAGRLYVVQDFAHRIPEIRPSASR